MEDNIKPVKKKNWVFRLNHGSPKKFTPKELIEEFVAYSDFCYNNPIMVAQLYQKTGELINVPKARVMTIKGFCLYAGMTESTFAFYLKDELYAEICEIIRDAIYNNKYEGAVAGVFNSNVVIRDLGLNDTVNHTLSDRRKSTAELFPTIEEIEAEVIDETTDEDIKKINDGSTKS